LKEAGYKWFAKLSNGLEDCGSVPSSVDPCIFFGQGCIVGDSMQRIDALIQSLH
jgi:hypothetical protein